MANITGIEDGKCTTDLDLNFKQLLNFAPGQIFPNSGYSGYSGVIGTSGYCGASGKSGYSGFSGVTAQDPVVRHIVATSGGTPTITVGSAAGTGASASVFGGSTDTAGRALVTTGTATDSTLGSTLCTVTFSETFANQPIVVLQPTNLYSLVIALVYVECSTTQIGLRIGSQIDEHLPIEFSWIAIGK